MQPHVEVVERQAQRRRGLLRRRAVEVHALERVPVGFRQAGPLLRGGRRHHGARVLLGQVLELRARQRTSGAIKALLGLCRRLLRFRPRRRRRRCLTRPATLNPAIKHEPRLFAKDGPFALALSCVLNTILVSNLVSGSA
jgi:hypothetical protein